MMAQPGSPTRDRRPSAAPALVFLLAALTLALVSHPGATLAQTVPVWEPVPFGPVLGPSTSSDRFDDIDFADRTHGWMVHRANGEIWHSADGGLSWQIQLDEPGTSFRSIAFANDQVGWAGTLTNGRTLWETRDGGTTWLNITDSIQGVDPAGICGMVAVSDNVVYGVGAFFGAPVVVRTKDGGQNWDSKFVNDVTDTLVDVYFFDDMTGIATGGTSTVSSLDGDVTVIRTEDGGETWERVYEGTRGPGIQGEWGWKITFPTPDAGYISVETISNFNGLPAKILKTTDGGRTWSPIEVDGSVSRAGLQGIGFVTADVGWAGGRGVTSLTTDGGNTWQQLEHFSTLTGTGQLDGNINRFLVVDDTTAFAIGQRVYQLNGLDALITDVIAENTLPDAFEIGEGYPNPFTDRVTLPFTLSRAQPVGFQVIDVLGRVLRIEPTTVLPAGEHTFTWDGTTLQGTRAASGNYIVLMDIGSSPEMKHVVRIR
ncbi:MAG: hypothetical protein COV99_01540 [Bacteroidetes bacterium CG12_big_fil_rev_8_21_14_0_65_60_17]|nr:MAG: hypothetical protein COV99_01540 [Bacteroidetes bacterium CG12_big_fil_rev_8_21_14_0_65_60_17]